MGCCSSHSRHSYTTGIVPVLLQQCHAGQGMSRRCTRPQYTCISLQQVQHRTHAMQGHSRLLRSLRPQMSEPHSNNNHLRTHRPSDSFAFANCSCSLEEEMRAMRGAAALKFLAWM